MKTQVDMWALGISVIEMAEVVPPRWKVHPMRVIFQIRCVIRRIRKCQVITQQT